MALLYADSFEHEDLDRYISVGQDTVFQAGRHGGQGIRLADTGTARSASFVQTIPDWSGDTLIGGFAINVTAFGGGQFFRITNDAGALVFDIRVSASGWTFRSASTVYQSVVGGAVNTSTWYWVEGKIFFDDTVGTAELRVNGATAGSIFNGDTTVTSVSVNQVHTAHSGGDSVDDSTGDDMVIMDGTGPAANDFTGDSQVLAFSPNADGALIELTGSDADQIDNFEQVNEAIPNDSDYNGSTGNTDKDYYQLGDLSTSQSYTIHGVQVVGRMAKSVGSDKFGRLIAMELGGSSTSLGPTVALSTDYVYSYLVLSQSPESVNWSSTRFDNLEIGYEVRDSTG